MLSLYVKAQIFIMHLVDSFVADMKSRPVGHRGATMLEYVFLALGAVIMFGIILSVFIPEVRALFVRIANALRTSTG